MNALQKLQQRYGSGEGRALYELILSQRFGLSRTDILLGKDTTLSAEKQAELQIIVDRVVKGEPVQYVLGCEEFCGHEFLVGPGVLIPRPETQQLAHLVEQNVAPGSTVLDVGTGSGCIAISLALAGYKVTALDVSDEALAIAKQNAERLSAEVEFVKGDILGNEELRIKNEVSSRDMMAAANSSFFILHSSFYSIVSNPPYICESEASAMDANVLDHEPRLALFVPDDDPLLFYRAISEFGREHLCDEGQIFFEVNRAYAEQVAELLQQKGYEKVQVVRDEYDNNRFVWARKIQD